MSRSPGATRLSSDDVRSRQGAGACHTLPFACRPAPRWPGARRTVKRQQRRDEAGRSRSASVLERDGTLTLSPQEDSVAPGRLAGHSSWYRTSLLVSLRAGKHSLYQADMSASMISKQRVAFWGGTQLQELQIPNHVRSLPGRPRTVEVVGSARRRSGQRSMMSTPRVRIRYARRDWRRRNRLPRSWRRCQARISAGSSS